MPVHVFCCFSVSEKYLRKYSRNWTGQKRAILEFRQAHGVQRGAGDAPEGSHTIGRHGTTHWRATRWCGPLVPPPTPPFRLFIPPYANTLNNPNTSPEKHSSPPPPSTLVREGSEALPGTLPERGIIAGGLYTTMPASGQMSE